MNVVLGCTTHEMVSFMGTPELWAADEATVRTMLNGMLGDAADRVFDGYRAANPDDSPASLFLLIASDQFMRIPHVRYTEALLAGAAAKPRMYLFDFRRPSPDGVERAGHGSDMPFFFDNLDKAPASDGPHGEPLVRAMSGALDRTRPHRRPEPRRHPTVAGLLDLRPDDHDLRRRSPRRERPNGRGAARLGRQRTRPRTRIIP